MNECLTKSCELFIKNRDRIKENFKWNYADLYPLCASIYTARNIEVDTEKIKQCREIIKSHTGLFSNFRGISSLALATMLSLEMNPEEKLKKTLTVYDLLKKEFFTSEYLTITAFMLVDMIDEASCETTIAKAKELYKCMKKYHPFLTSSDDYVYAVLFAMKDMPVEESGHRIEKCYSRLKSELWGGNALQALSHVLALFEGDIEQICNKAIEIYEKLKDRGLKYGNGMQLATLGVLALLPKDTESIVLEVCELYDYIKAAKGFGTFSMDKGQRIMYSAVLVSNQYTDGAMNQNMKAATVSNSILTIIIAQQTAMVAAIAAASIAASSANS